MRGCALVMAVGLRAMIASASGDESERRAVCGPEEAGRWVAEESTVEAAAVPGVTERAVLRWHVPVDYYAGEAKYPVGWPRAHWAIADVGERDWSGWDFLQLRVFTTSSRACAPT